MANAQENTTIRPVELRDADGIALIYNHFVTTTVITFEEEPVIAAEIVGRIEEVRSVSLPWLVAEQKSQVAGYAYATPWRSRAAYRFSVEITVYVAPGRERLGIGSMLYSRLFPMLEAQHVHAVIAGIALPNDASIALHEKFGLRKAAEFREVGFKFDRWINVGYWHRTL